MKLALAVVVVCALAGSARANVDAGTPDAQANADVAPPDADAARVVQPDASSPDVQPPPVVTGRVFAKGSRTPVGGLSLTIDGVPLGETDESGRFAVPLPPGRHTFQIVHPEFESFTAIVDTAADTPALVFRLVPGNTHGAYETVVRAPPVEGARVSLTQHEATTTPGSLGDPFRVIESLPGVAPIVWPLAVYAIRGANPGNTGFFLDDQRIPALFHFALGPAVIHPYFLGGLDFYPGGYPARLGRYISGAVSASTQAPPTDRGHGSIDVRVFDAGGLVSTPIDQGRGTVVVAGRYGYPAALLNQVQNEASVQYWDYQLRADHVWGPGKLTLTAFGSYDSLESRTGSFNTETRTQEKERIVLAFHRAQLRWRGRAAGTTFTAALGAGWDAIGAPIEDQNDASVRTRSVLPRVGATRPLGETLELEVGAEGEMQWHSANVRNANADLAAFARTRTSKLAAVFAALVWRPSPWLVVTPSLRLDSYGEDSDSARDLGPRLSVRVRAREGVWLKAQGGRYSQMPSMPVQLPGFEGFGLAQHGLQSSWQSSAGVEAELNRDLTLDVTGFLQRYVVTDIRDPDLGDPIYADFLTRRKALSYGLEVLLRRPATGPFHGWLSYTWSHSQRLIEGGVVTDSDWDQRHVLNLVAGWRVGRYTLGGRIHLHSGRPVKVQDARVPEFQRLPPFYQLDVRIDRRFLYDQVSLDLYLELLNTTLTRQVVDLRYDHDEERIVEEGFRLAIPLPALGMRIEF